MKKEINIEDVMDVCSKKPIHLDDILAKFKLLGWYNIKLIPLVALVFLSNSIFCKNYIFTVREVGYTRRCMDERIDKNNCSGLFNSTEVCTEWVYDDPYTFMAEECLKNLPKNQVTSYQVTMGFLIPYDQFQLACQEWKRTLVGTVHSFGYMIGLILVGPFSDRIGRKRAIAITGTLSGLMGVARSFATSYWIFVLFEFLEASLGDVGSPIFMYAIEMVDHYKRLSFLTLCILGFALGYSVLSLTAWLIPYWRHLLRVLYAPAIFFIFYLYLIDESPRWHLSRGNKSEAVAVVNKIAKVNGVKLDKEAIDNLAYEENIEVSFNQLLKNTITSKTLLKRLLICLCWWTTSTFVSYGLHINSMSLQGNNYINFALISVVEVLSQLTCNYLLWRYRRKIPLACCFFISCIMCLSQPFIPRNYPWLSILLYMTGTFMSGLYFQITYVYTSEIFPTYTRNSMHALCSSIGRIGAIIAPQTPLLIKYWSGAPSFLFGCASLAAGFATLFAPDTADDALPDNVTQAEALGKVDIKKKPSKSINKTGDSAF